MARQQTEQDSGDVIYLEHKIWHGSFHINKDFLSSCFHEKFHSDR